MYFRTFLALLSCRLALGELRSATSCFETVLLRKALNYGVFNSCKKRRKSHIKRTLLCFSNARKFQNRVFWKVDFCTFSYLFMPSCRQFVVRFRSFKPLSYPSRLPMYPPINAKNHSPKEAVSQPASTGYLIYQIVYKLLDKEIGNILSITRHHIPFKKYFSFNRVLIISAILKIVKNFFQKFICAVK